MSRSKMLGTRVESDTAFALDRAAAAAGCSVAYLMNIILVRWLTARGYLAGDSEALP